MLHAGAGDGDRELGRTSRLCGSGAVPTTVLLEDGRLFRIEVRGLSPARVELSSDETPGAYLVARPVGRGFEIETTVAGRALVAGPALLLLFGAEIARLAADGGAFPE